MRGRIESGQLVTLTPADPMSITVGDAVFVKWRDNYLLHLVTDRTATEVQIGNNLGKINGWIPVGCVLGRVTCVRDEEIVVGTVSRVLQGFCYCVEIDSADSVDAIVPKQLRRELTELRIGDRVRVGGVWNRNYRILGLDMVE